jgi:UbiD family decarboxylase
VVEGARGSTLDPSSDGTTAKLGLDATVPEGADREMFRRVN